MLVSAALWIGALSLARGDDAAAVAALDRVRSGRHAEPSHIGWILTSMFFRPRAINHHFRSSLSSTDQTILGLKRGNCLNANLQCRSSYKATKIDNELSSLIMKTNAKSAIAAIAAALITTSAAFASDVELVQIPSGRGDHISIYRPVQHNGTPTVAIYSNRHGVASSATLGDPKTHLRLETIQTAQGGQRSFYRPTE
jgi:hypothetical protein